MMRPCPIAIHLPLLPLWVLISALESRRLQGAVHSPLVVEQNLYARNVHSSRLSSLNLCLLSTPCAEKP